MKRTLLLLLLGLLMSLSNYTAWGQTTKFPTTADLEKVYTKAIGDFIKDVNKNNRIPLDTLFFRKRTNEEESSNNFPDIQLPESIENVHVRLIAPEIGDIQQKELKHRISINLFGWVDNQKIKFDFFVFSNGFEYKFNYRIEYEYNPQRKEYELKKLIYSK